MNTYKLKTGIEIEDNRDLGCGVVIKNQTTKYMTLSYSNNNNFYANVSSAWLDMEGLKQLQDELDILRLSIIEAKQILTSPLKIK